MKNRIIKYLLLESIAFIAFFAYYSFCVWIGIKYPIIGIALVLALITKQLNDIKKK